VIAPAKLTIAAGTIVQGDALAADKPALIVARGGQLIAKGTKDKPIVFTSSAAAGSRRGGDWAGVALLAMPRSTPARLVPTAWPAAWRRESRASPPPS
jgi:hypothetical protein